MGSKNSWKADATATCCRCGKRSRVALWNLTLRFVNRLIRSVRLCRSCTGAVSVGDTLNHGCLSYSNRLTCTVEELPGELLEAQKEEWAVEARGTDAKDRQAAKASERKEEEERLAEIRQRRTELLLKQRALPPLARKLARQCRLSNSGRPWFAQRSLRNTETPLWRVLRARGFKRETVVAVYAAFDFPLHQGINHRWPRVELLRKLGWRERKALREMPRAVRRDYLIDKGLSSSERRLIY